MKKSEEGRCFTLRLTSSQKLKKGKRPKPPDASEQVSRQKVSLHFSMRKPKTGSINLEMCVDWQLHVRPVSSFSVFLGKRLKRFHSFISNTDMSPGGARTGQTCTVMSCPHRRTLTEPHFVRKETQRVVTPSDLSVDSVNLPRDEKAA